MNEAEHSPEEEPLAVPKRNPVVWAIWNVLFVLMYPVLAAFSLIVMLLMFISSTLSTGLYKIIGLFRK